MKIGGPKLHLSLKFIYLILEILNGFLSAQILFQKDVEPSVLGSSQALCKCGFREYQDYTRKIRYCG
jgi:hypothetical protein